MRRILVIDDNEDLRYLMQVILGGAGYEVEQARDGQAGIQAQDEQPYDLIITDIFMPHQDGIETISVLHRRFPDLKVIAVSGGGSIGLSRGYLVAALEVGAHRALTKPIEPESLLEAVRALIGDPQSA